MSAPLFLVDPEDLPDEVTATTLRLEGPEGRHAADVQRLAVGEPVLVSDGVGRYARCTVSQTHKGALDLEVHEVWTAPEPDLRLVLVQALAKGDRDLLAVEAATELDVDEVVPWQADRSIARWKPDKMAKAHAKWQQAVIAATKQSRRARVPVVHELAHRRQLLERVDGATLSLVLHEEAEEPLAEVDLPEEGTLLLAVGPEGGITRDELDALVGAGARPVRLGRSVLRTSTAGAAALAVLHTRTGWR